jgi:hypothetical protein
MAYPSFTLAPVLGFCQVSPRIISFRPKANSPKFVGSQEPVTFQAEKGLHPAKIFIKEMPQNFLGVTRRGPSNFGAGVIWSCQVVKTEQLGVTPCFIH